MKRSEATDALSKNPERSRELVSSGRGPREEPPLFGVS